MHRARPAVAKTGEVFVVEGYTDVIGLAQAGIDQRGRDLRHGAGGAPLRQLSRFATRAILSFDSDEAGARAAERAFAVPGAVPDHAVVLIMPEGSTRPTSWPSTAPTPCGAAAASARPLVEYMVRRTVERHDLATIEGQLRRGRRRPADPRAPRRSDPAVRIRGAARRSGGRLARERRAVARAPPQRQACRGRARR